MNRLNWGSPFVSPPPGLIRGTGQAEQTINFLLDLAEYIEKNGVAEGEVIWTPNPMTMRNLERPETMNPLYNSTIIIKVHTNE